MATAAKVQRQVVAANQIERARTVSICAHPWRGAVLYTLYGGVVRCAGRAARAVYFVQRAVGQWRGLLRTFYTLVDPPRALAEFAAAHRVGGKKGSELRALIYQTLS